LEHFLSAQAPPEWRQGPTQGRQLACTLMSE
jgi:hypothetical protein